MTNMSLVHGIQPSIIQLLVQLADRTISRGEPLADKTLPVRKI